MVKLTRLSKGLIAASVLGSIGYGVYRYRGNLAPAKKQTQVSNVPPAVPDLPVLPDRKPAGVATLADQAPGCAILPEVRFYHWAWNAQMGLMLANGGKQAISGSLMCKNEVNLKLIREDNVDTMQALLLTFAERLKKGEANPTEGAHFVAVMGDGSASFLKGLNDRMRKLGADYEAVVVGSSGFSRGEDKFMGPPAWKKDPQAARGGFVAGYLRDGDWNIALKWLSDNKIPNNPDDTTYDPGALNWHAASDYIDAAQKYVSGYCAELKNIKTGKKEKHCVDGVVTWTPGDVTVAENRGGLVSIVSTQEYRSQMPMVIIGNRKWMAANRKIVQGMLSATFAAGDEIKSSPAALSQAAAISAVVYNEKDAAYWEKYFTIQTVKDKQGLTVELGGSSVNNLADNLELFGMTQGSANLFAATYTVFGNLVKSQYPDLLPSFDPVEKVLDTSYVAALAKDTNAPTTKAEQKVFAVEAELEEVVSRKAWDIQFAVGSAAFTPSASRQLETLEADLLIAGGTLVEIHGHTDNVGGIEKNQKLSESRAFAVKQWLEKQSSRNFPEGRIRIFAHGQTQPLAPNESSDGRAKNRRVEIVIGTDKN